jgi:uncharacterized protein YehS (DUF1456 family)
MQNNDIIRRIRFIFDINDDKMIKIFSLAELKVNREQVCNWLKKEDEPDAVAINDKHLAIFLNGFISLNRGKKEGPQPKPEKTLTNNIIFRKLKIALNLKDTDIMEIYENVHMIISKHEISALFRKPEQKQFRKCKDQFLRNFLYGLQIKYRGEF